MSLSSDIPNDLLAGFFRVAVAYFNTKPWTLPGPADKVWLRIGMDAPFYAFASGGDDDSTPGLTLTPAFPADDEDAITQGLMAFGGHHLRMRFTREADAPEWLAERRREQKFALASPAAFPSFTALDAHGVERQITESELNALSLGVSVMAAYVGANRSQIRARQSHGVTVTVRDHVGATHIAMAQFPFDETDPSGWRDFKFQKAADPAQQAFHDVWNAALDLPQTPTVLDRLSWSFFLDAGPSYAEHDEDEDDAYFRFLSWALFAHRGESGTLAEQTLAVLAESMSPDELEVHRRVVVPRGSIFRVTAVTRRKGFHAHDELRDEVLEFIEKTATRHLEEEKGVLGLVLPISDSQWILAPGCALYPTLPDVPPGDGPLSAEQFALSQEQVMFGANVEWVQAEDVEQIRHAYEGFAVAFEDTGDSLPAFETLQQDIASADQPGHLMQRLSERITWWSDGELNVMLALVMRIWNLTPRPDLGGQSPDERAMHGERVRAVRPKGARRR